MPSARVRGARAVYIICFAIGTLSHARDFATHGWRPYQWGVPILEIFWTTLILQDAATIALFLTNRLRAALIAAVTIMTLDVAANSYALFALHLTAFAPNLVLQTLFYGFILGSITFLWPARK